MKLERIAIANQLGQELTRFRTSLLVWLILAIAALIIGSILVLGIPVGGGWVIKVPFLGAVLLLLVPCILGAMVWSMPMCLVLYERGLIYKNWKTTKVISYSDIQSFIWQKPIQPRDDQPIDYTQSNQESFVLHLRNGDRFEVPIVLDNLEKLHMFLQNYCYLQGDRREMG